MLPVSSASAELKNHLRQAAPWSCPQLMSSKQCGPKEHFSQQVHWHDAQTNWEFGDVEPPIQLRHVVTPSFRKKRTSPVPPARWPRLQAPSIQQDPQGATRADLKNHRWADHRHLWNSKCPACVALDTAVLTFGTLSTPAKSLQSPSCSLRSSSAASSGKGALDPK